MIKREIVKMFFTIACACLLTVACQKPILVQETPLLIPAPKELVVKAGIFKIKPDAQVIIEQGTGATEAVEQFIRFLNEKTGYKIELSTGSKDEGGNIFIRLQNDELWKPEQYKLTITPERIELAAGEKIGIVHGINSLRQLFPNEIEKKNAASVSGSLALPCLEISDYPSYSWRGMMLDPCRHFVHKDTVLKYIDLLAFYKMNVLHLHLNDNEGWRVEIKQYPKLTSESAKRSFGDGITYHHYYSQDDIKEIVQYAAEKGIMVIPEIDLPGHAGAVMPIFQEFHCSGYMKEIPNVWLKGEDRFGRSFCAGNPKSLEFIVNVLKEVVELFPCKYIHIGGDETQKNFWEECSKCQNAIRKNKLENEEELQSWFMSEVSNFLKTKKRIPVGWDEIIEGGLIEDAIVQSWRGPKGGVLATEHGHKVIMSYGPSYFNRHLQISNVKAVYNYNPAEGVNDSLSNLVIGAECCLWSEFIQDEEELDLQTFPKLPALAERLWSGKSAASWDTFKPILESHCERLSFMGIAVGRWDISQYTPSLPATVSSDMVRCYNFPGSVRYDLQNFRPEAAFDGDDKTVCMRVGPQKDECFTILLDDSTFVNNLSVKTGSKQNTYKWLHGDLEVSEDGEKYEKVGSLNDGTISIDVNKNIKSFRLRATKSQDIHNWVVIRDFTIQ